MERGEEGYPKLTPPTLPQLSPRAMFVGRCHSVNIRDPEQIAALWAEEKVKLAAMREKAKEFAKKAREQERERKRKAREAKKGKR